MKRELAAMLLLAALLGGAVWSLIYYDHLTDDIKAALSLSEEAAASDDFEGAHEHFQRAQKIWRNAEGYTHIFIRHPEIDGANDAFFELQQMLDEENAAGCRAAFEKLRYHLDCVDLMEHPRLGSIF